MDSFARTSLCLLLLGIITTGVAASPAHPLAGDPLWRLVKVQPLDGETQLFAYEEDAEASMATATYRLRLIVVRGDRSSVFDGQRPPDGMAILPHAGATLSIERPLPDGPVFVRAVNDYAHGYYEQTTTLLHLDSETLRLTRAWSGTTASSGPSGLDPDGPTRTPARLEYNQVEGLYLRYGDTASRWLPDQKCFE